MNINRYIIKEKYNNYFDYLIIKDKIDIIKNKFENTIILNPFSNNNLIANINNDLDSTINSNYHLEALDFLRTFSNNSADIILYDPPTDPTRMKFYFDKLNLKIDKRYTRTEYWSKLKKEISRILKKDGYAISIGYNSGGIGKTNGFNIEDILILSHISFNRDIFCVIEKKMK